MGTEIRKSDVFVLVPSYNHARYIGDCLKSIIQQTVPPSKLLVIDDGSKDDSVSVIETILKDCPFESELIARENRGLCATLNEGLEKSAGEFFAYLGSDDLWLPFFLEARTQMLAGRPNAVLGYGHSYLIDENNFITDSSENYQDDWAFFPNGDPMPMLSYGTSPVSSTVVYRRESLAGLQWNEAAKLEDYEMYLQLSQHGEFAFDPDVHSAWRRHGENTSDDVTMMFEEILGAQQRMLDRGAFDEAQLDVAMRRTKFRFARLLLQSGQKTAALKLASGNYSGARSFTEKAAFGLRMCTPMGIVDFLKGSRSNKQGLGKVTDFTADRAKDA